MQRLITFLSITIVIISIYASFGFTSRTNISDNRINDVEGDIYAYLDRIADPFSYDYLNNGTAMLSDSTDSLNKLVDSRLLKINSTIADSLVFEDSLGFDANDTLTNILERGVMGADSTITDSVVVVDSMAIDSTARLKHFQYVQPDYYSTSPTDRFRSSFFVYPSASVSQKSIELDSTGQFVLIKESIIGNESRVMVKMPLSEYIEKMIAEVNKRELNALTRKYEVLNKDDDLGSLLSDITNIEIPLPSASFLSIFGPPKINLRISGAVDIHGAWRNETTEGVALSALGNSRNEPDFSQQVQISVNGTIGDKLTIGADWNTERTFEYENQLKLQYKGYDDEMIQSIEAGNVSLQTSPLVGGSEALFGIKAKFQFGPFTLTALASQKKGEVKEVSVSGGSEKQTYSIEALNYSENNYFLDTVYASVLPEYNFFNKYFGKLTPEVNNEYFVKDLEVWREANGNFDPATQKRANVYINLPALKQGETYDDSLRYSNAKVVQGETIIFTYFERLQEGVDYIYNAATGFITFKTQIQRTDAIGVAYRTEGKNGNDITDDNIYGDFWNEIKDSVIVLKLIKPDNLNPTYEQAWKLQLRNIYPLGGRDIKKEGFTFDMFYTIEGFEPQNNVENKNLLNQFRLDILDNSGQENTDGLFDFREGITIIPETGEIIFPTLEPFGRDLPPALPKDIAYYSLYSELKSTAQEDKTKNKFDLTGEYSASVSSTFQIGFNVVENSVKVTLDNTALILGVDYVVDYNIGQITMRNANALVPGANLKITFEQNDLFQLASKTLIGFRGIYEFSKETKLGFSFLNLNQKTLSDKVRIGEEPISNTIYGVDFSTKHDLPFLTTALDKVFSTSAKSSLDLAGEFAYMDPDPNTKKSTITSDNNKSIAYIDDFESSKRTIPIGISYTGWKDLSVPDEMPYDDGEAKVKLMDYKAKSIWYNILPSKTSSRSIWPNKDVSTKNEEVTVLDYVYRPNQKGSYNSNPDLEGNSDKVWGGIMKSLSSSANNLVEEKIEAIEFWINIQNAPEGAVLNLDLGQISEDVIQNSRLDTEDKEPWNDNIDEGEDIGLDRAKNVNEPEYDAATNKDPNGDDFKFISGGVLPDDYAQINGTEGNASLSESGRFPDSEDLNGNKKLDKINSYFRYEIPLDTSVAVNPFVAGGGAIKDDGTKSTWYQFKIPLKDYKKMIGSPTFSLVEFIRLWVSGSSEEIHFQLVEFNLVGNQWQKLLTENVTLDDSVLTVSNVNREDNPDYIMPPGIAIEKDRTNPDQVTEKNEQSLDLIIKDLPDGDSRTVVKYLPKGLDVFNYSEMKLFIRGDADISQGSISHYVNENNYATDLYFRFGADSTNYYEYIRPTKFVNDVDDGWEEISVNFNDLSTIKETRPADSANVAYRVPVPGKPGHYYGIRGAPTLTKVSFLALGIQNPKDKGDKFEKVSGRLWINELRVIGANDHEGWAMSASASLKFADIVSVSGSYRQTDPYFHKLSERFGSRVDSRSWNIQSNVNIIKLMPFNMPGSNLSVNYSHSESISKPLYKPRTDVLVSKAAETSTNPDSLVRETETLNISDTWSLSNIQLKVPSKEWYIRETINGLSFSYSYNSTNSRNPATEEAKTWGWNGTGKYQAKFSNDNFIYPANIPIIGEFFKLFSDYRNVKIYFTPQNFDASLAAKRNYSFTKTRTIGLAPNISRDFTSSRNVGFNWKLTDGGFFNISTGYKLSVASSLGYLLTDINGIERSESEIWNDIFNGNLFGKDNNYSQSINFDLKPQMPSLLNLDKYFTISAGYDVTYNWQNNFSQAELGRSAGWANRINASLTVKLKQIMTPIFELIISDDKKAVNNKSKNNISTPRSRFSKDESQNVDEQIKDQDEKNKANNPADSVEVIDNSPSIFTKGLSLVLGSMQYALFDFDQMVFNFSQNNTQGNSGIVAEGTGFWNFWGSANNDINGPSRLYQFGLSNNPGPRAAGGKLDDKFSQKNDFSIKTRRPLWEGANVDINWDIGWGYNKSISFEVVDEYTGELLISDPLVSGSLDRSFLTLPLAGASIKSVNDKYDPNAEDPNASLSSAFVEGLESIPIFAKIPIFNSIAQYIPRPNWRITWTGLEKLPLVGLIFQRASLNHGYTSKYTEGWKINVEGNEEVQTQKISYGFSPLVGLNLTFAELWGGNITGNIKYSTKKDYTLGLATKATTETFSNDINISLSFAKAGFELPLFGLSLKNDIEVSMAYTQGTNSVLMYYMGENFKEAGTPQDGTKRVTIEPRIKYVMSARVTLSIFYKRMTVEPEGASKIPATTTNEAGLDVHISIQ
ncbi:MAG: cell surface protein SprA [Bacteroidetes bacterium]|nr:cell surface protein SprA [Bacteroidota bacterium]MBU1114230.1 cell surface protein SprA [Bacteroidota bacterium]MBU1797360.1 cell surface protein SprA [Bacteroidota bacterium]